MGLLTALNLPRPRNWPTGACAVVARSRPTAMPVEARQAASVAAGGGEPEDEPVAASGQPAGQGAVTGDKPKLIVPPQGIDIGYGDFGAGVKTSNDGTSLIVKWEHQKPLAQQNFQISVVPCYTEAAISVGVTGEIVLSGKGSNQLVLGASGSFKVGIGKCEKGITAGAYGQVALTAQTSLPTSLSAAGRLLTDPCKVDIYGSGKVGLEFKVEDSISLNTDCEVMNWHLFVLTFGSGTGEGVPPFTVAPGADMQRLFGALQTVGPKLAKAVKDYAPEAVKKVAEDGAEWVAESPEAREIADVTGSVLDEVKEDTGWDIGGALEKAVQVSCDPGGQTGSESSDAVAKMLKEDDEKAASFDEALTRAGLRGGELSSTRLRSADEINEILAAQGRGDDWRAMVDALAKTARARKNALLKQQAEAERLKKAQADADAIAQLKRRVAEADVRMKAAEQAANGPGNHLNNTAPATGKRREAWLEGMRSRDPGTNSRMAALSLQGEARIAKADEATAYFMKAKAAFERGAHLSD